MIKSARLATLCLILVVPSALLTAAEADNAPIIIQRAPEPVQTAPAEELTALRNENQRLSKELTKAREVLERLQADAASVASERAKETTAAEQNAREVAELRAKVVQTGAATAVAKPAADDALLKKYETVQAAARSLEAKNEMLTSTLSAANARIAELSSAKPNEDLKAQVAAQKARADEAIARLNTIVMGVDNLNAEKGLLEAQLADVRRSEASLREQLASAKSGATAAPAPDLTAKLTDAEGKLAGLQRNLSAVQAENDLLKTASADNARLTAELQSLRQEKAVSDTKSPEMASKLADVESKLSTTLRSYSLIQAENEQLKKAAAERTQQADELGALRKQNADLEARLAAASAAPAAPAGPSEAEKKLETVLRSFSQLQAENDQLKQAAADHAKQSGELENLRKQNADLESRLAAASATPAPTNETTPAPAAAPAQASDAENKLSTVLRSYSLLQAENDRLKAEADHNVQTAQAAAAKTSADAAAQMAALFDELRQTKASLTALSAENSQLKTRLALAGSPPGSTLASPSRPGSAAAVAASAPAPTASASTPAAPATERKHVVAAGDTLGKISRQYYGSSNRWEDILRANAGVVKDPNALTVGTTLRIP